MLTTTTGPSAANARSAAGSGGSTQPAPPGLPDPGQHLLPVTRRPVSAPHARHWRRRPARGCAASTSSSSARRAARSGAALRRASAGARASRACASRIPPARLDEDERLLRLSAIDGPRGGVRGNPGEPLEQLLLVVAAQPAPGQTVEEADGRREGPVRRCGRLVRHPLDTIPAGCHLDGKPRASSAALARTIVAAVGTSAAATNAATAFSPSWGTPVARYRSRRTAPRLASKAPRLG